MQSKQNRLSSVVELIASSKQGILKRIDSKSKKQRKVSFYNNQILGINEFDYEENEKPRKDLNENVFSDDVVDNHVNSDIESNVVNENEVFPGGIKENEYENRFSVKRITLNNNKNKEKAEFDFVSPLKKDNFNEITENNQPVNQNQMIINEYHIEENNNSPLKNRRSRGMEGSIQKMRVTIAALKKPKFNIQYNQASQVSQVNQMKINNKEDKGVKRESMPNFFANTVITDEDLLQFEDENKENSQIKSQTEKEKDGEVILNENNMDVDQNNDNNHEMNVSFNANINIDSHINNNKNMNDISILTFNSSPSHINNTDQNNHKPVNQVKSPSITERIANQIKEIQLEREEQSRQSIILKNEISSMIENKNLTKEMLIVYTKLQIENRRKEIEEEMKRSEIFSKTIQSLKDNIKAGNDVYNQKNERENENEMKRNMFKSNLLLLKNQFLKGGVRFSYENTKNVLIVNVLSFFKFIFSIDLTDGNKHISHIDMSDESEIKIQLKDIKIDILSSDLSSKTFSSLYQILRRKIQKEFSLNFSYSYKDFIKTKLKSLIKSISPIGFFFQQVLPTLNYLKPTIEFEDERQIDHLNVRVLFQIDYFQFSAIKFESKIELESVFNNDPVLKIEKYYLSFDDKLVTVNNFLEERRQSFDKKIKFMIEERRKSVRGFIENEKFIQDFYIGIYEDVIQLYDEMYSK